MQRIVVLLLVLLVTACVAREPGFYKHSPSVPMLEIPPDLTKPEFEDSFDVPQIGKLLTSKVTLSEGAEVELKRDGRLRWLEIGSKSDLVWELLHDFWEHNKIALEWENPKLGIMETEWIEYPESEYAKDKFRVRVEPIANDKTAVYITHRGIQQAFSEGDLAPVWTNRPSDEELEIEVIGLLLDYLSLEPKRKQALLEKARSESPDSVLKLDADPPSLEIHTAFGRTWQLVALSVDRMGHIIESRNRDAGKLVVRLGDEADAAIAGSLFSKREKVTLRFKELGNDLTQLWLEDADGHQDSSEEARNFLIRIKENLK